MTGAPDPDDTHRRAPRDPSTVLLVGLPRSGTTWTSGLLSGRGRVEQLYEPDNEKLNPIACHCKGELHRFPYLEAADRSAAFQALWSLALSGGWPDSGLRYRLLRWWFRRSCVPSVEASIGERTGLCYVDERWNDVRRDTTPFRAADHPVMTREVRRYLRPPHRPKGRPLVVKSVHAPLALDWIDGRFETQVVVLLRNPFALYTSYFRRKFPDGDRHVRFQKRLRRRPELEGIEVRRPRLVPADLSVALQILIVYRVLASQLSADRGWVVVSHDRLCSDPVVELDRLLRKLPEPWKSWDAREFIGSQDPSTLRDRAVRWRTEIERSQFERIEALIDVLDLGSFFAEEVYAERLEYTPV